MGQLAEAEALLRDAYDQRVELLPPKHPDVARTLYNLSLVLRDAGKLTQAETAIREVLDLQRESNPEHPDVADALDTLVTILCARNQPAEAEQRAREAVALRKKVQGERAQWVALSLDALVEALSLQNKTPEAEEFARESLGIIEATEPDSWQRFNSASVLGGILLTQGKLSDAEPLLISGHNGLKQREAELGFNDRPRLRASVERLVKFYEAANRPDEAAKWKQKLGELDKPAK